MLVEVKSGVGDGEGWGRFCRSEMGYGQGGGGRWGGGLPSWMPYQVREHEANKRSPINSRGQVNTHDQFCRVRWNLARGYLPCTQPPRHERLQGPYATH